MSLSCFILNRLLHQAALWDNAELLEDLLTSNGDELACLNARDSWGRTALHAAATNHESQCLRILVQVQSLNVTIENGKLWLFYIQGSNLSASAKKYKFNFMF